jgi:hypothetical protein
LRLYQARCYITLIGHWLFCYRKIAKTSIHQFTTFYNLQHGYANS